MSVGARLGAFLLVLLGTFGTAYAVGEKLPGHSHSGHTHGPGSVVPPGFESNGHRLVTDSVKGADGEPRLLTFHLEMTDGMRVTEFDDNHGALLPTTGRGRCRSTSPASGTWCSTCCRRARAPRSW
jgi:hypothetical protein